MATLPQDEEVYPDNVSEATSEDQRSTLTLVRNVVMNLTRVVEDSTELIGASVHEELAQFREDMARHLLSLVAIVIAGSLATAGLAMLVRQWIGSWPITLLIFGAIYFLIAGGLRLSGSRGEEDGWK